MKAKRERMTPTELEAYEVKKRAYKKAKQERMTPTELGAYNLKRSEQMTDEARGK